MGLAGRWGEVRQLMRELAEERYMQQHHDLTPNPPTLHELRRSGLLDEVKPEAIRTVRDGVDTKQGNHVKPKVDVEEAEALWEDYSNDR